LAELEDARRRRAHIRFGELLLEREPLSLQDAVAAGVHLLRGGELARGGKLVVRAATDTAPTDLQRSIARLFEEALTLFRGAGGASSKQIGPRARLSIAGYYADRGLAFRYGEETLGLFAQLFHLSTALRLRPWLGKRLGLLLALTWSAFEFARRRRNPLVP